MTGIADTGPDIVYLGAMVNNNAAKLLQDMRAVMPVEEVMFLGPDGLINQAFVEGAGTRPKARTSHSPVCPPTS